MIRHFTGGALLLGGFGAILYAAGLAETAVWPLGIAAGFLLAVLLILSAGGKK